MQITTKGQVTIPKNIRDSLGLLPHSEVEFTLDGDRVYMRKKERKNRRGKRIVNHLKGREGRARTGMSTNDIMALLRGDED